MPQLDLSLRWARFRTPSHAPPGAVLLPSRRERPGPGRDGKRCTSPPVPDMLFAIGTEIAVHRTETTSGCRVLLILEMYHGCVRLASRR